MLAGLRLLICVGALVGVIGAMAACDRSPVPVDEEVGPVGVRVEAIRIGTLRDVVTASGVVAPSAAGAALVYAPEAAEVVDLPWQEGDTVAPGDVLVRFEIASLTHDTTARELAVAEARGRADHARSEFARLSDLFERGIVARNVRDAARAAQAAAESQLGQAVAQRDLTNAQAERAVVRARFAGTVVDVWHAEGEFVRGDSSDPVMRVMDPSRLQVAVELPIADLARVLVGQSAGVQAITGDAIHPATVALKPLTTDPNAPTGQVRLAFADPAVLPLDTPVNVEIVIDRRDDALMVPVTAVLRDALSSYVMVAGDDGLAHRREVQTGLITDTFAQVTGGLSVDELIVVGGLAGLADGMAISFLP